jgi:hypothetical protein
MLRKWMTKWLEEWIAGTLLLVSTVLLSTFSDRIAAVMGTRSHTLLLLRLLLLSMISCAYLGWKFCRLSKRIKEAELVRPVSGVEFRFVPKTGRKWLPFCPKCHVPIYPSHNELAGFACHSGCGWHSPISADEIWEIVAKGK